MSDSHATNPLHTTYDKRCVVEMIMALKARGEPDRLAFRKYLEAMSLDDLAKLRDEVIRDASPSLLQSMETPLLPTLPVPRPVGIIEMTVAEQMTVRELADALKQKPFRIINDLMEFGVFANENQWVTFEIIALVVREYGYTAKKAV